MVSGRAGTVRTLASVLGTSGSAAPWRWEMHDTLTSYPSYERLGGCGDTVGVGGTSSTAVTNYLDAKATRAVGARRTLLQVMRILWNAPDGKPNEGPIAEAIAWCLTMT